MKRTQVGWVFLIIIPAVSYFVWQMDPTSSKLMPMYMIMGLILINFSCMTIKVDDDFVRVAFGIGLIRWKYPISNIEQCKSISYLALGWGIRFRPGAILFNVSGNKAIELTIKGKDRKVWLGTDRPDELAAYITARLKK
jgi:hypothetical protein